MKQWKPRWINYKVFLEIFYQPVVILPFLPHSPRQHSHIRTHLCTHTALYTQSHMQPPSTCSHTHATTLTHTFLHTHTHTHTQPPFTCSYTCSHMQSPFTHYHTHPYTLIHMHPPYAHTHSGICRKLLPDHSNNNSACPSSLCRAWSISFGRVFFTIGIYNCY